MKQSIEKMRIEYAGRSLECVDCDPFTQFKHWFKEAVACKVFEPNGMTLATATSSAYPSSRTVLLKQIDREGFLFFTSYESRKADQIEQSEHVALTFWWKEIYRQVNIEGRIEKVSRALSLAYFSKRPKGAQLAALASTQGEELESEDELLEKFQELKKQYRGKNVPCPKTWGGYRVIPNRFEFWQGKKNRLHNRFCYVKKDGIWISSRLSP